VAFCNAMNTDSTKQVAEALLRELPSVIGACVREDVHGHPREIHLLVRAGPNPRHLAYDVRDLLEERLGIPIDQRVISIAQLAPGKRPGPMLAGGAAASDAPAPAVAPEASATAAPVVDEVAGAEPAGQDDEAAEPTEPRLLFTGISTESMDNRVRIRISLDFNGTEHRGEAAGLDTAAARLHTCAAATLQAVDRTCAGRARFEVEQISVVRAFEREYVLISSMVSSPYLGRRPIALVGAHPVELDGESAVALAALKAVNRILSPLLRLGGPVVVRPRSRVRRS
jgi:hypothetical protein